MNCEQMNELLSAWLDGELSPAEQERMQEHLEQCAQCRALLEQLQALRSSFSDLEEIAAPEGFAEGVMDRIAADSRPKVVPLFKRPAFRGAVSVAACAVLFVAFGRPGMDSRKGAEAAAPEAADFAVDYVTAESGIVAEYSLESPAECAPEAAEMPVMEPAAPAPEREVCATNDTSGIMESKISADAARGGLCEIILHQLPGELENELGQLMWEERLEDGARCARLTAEQAERLTDLLRKQELEFETISGQSGEDSWILVWIPD